MNKIFKNEKLMYMLAGAAAIVVGKKIVTAETTRKAAVNSISSAIAQASKLVENGVDVQPTIRPVIDLSEINDGIKVLNGMFSSQNSIGVSGNLLAISSMRAGIQNASNADVIAAINNLQRSLDEHPSNIYNIDGITYDDGSNITSAVKELIKAVRIEKRA